MVSTERLTYETFGRYYSIVQSFKQAEVDRTISADRGLVVGGCVNRVPAGIIAVTYPYHTRDQGTISYVYVVPEYRGRGVGSSLMRQGIQLAKENGLVRLSIRYPMSSAWGVQLHHITAENGFMTVKRDCFFKLLLDQTPRETLYNVCQRRLGSRNVHVPEPYRMIPYASMTEYMRRSLQEGQGRWYPDHLSPLQGAGGVDRQRSLLLMRHDEVVGWLLIGYAGMNAVDFRNLFIREGHRNTGHFLRLLLAASKWLVDDIRIKRLVYNVDEANERFLSLMRRFLDRDTYTETTITHEELWLGCR